MSLLRACRVLALALIVAACGGEPDNINIGAQAPAFETPVLDGEALRFPADTAGRIVVLRFWADWCRFCEPEMRDMEPVYQALREHGVEFLAINAGQSPATVEAFVRKLDISYPVLLDEGSAIARSYGVIGLPTTFFIDGEGVVRGKLLGETTPAVFRAQLDKLLEALR